MDRNDFDSAAAAIASECAQRWDSTVTPSDTVGWVNADSIHDWLQLEVGLRSPQSILAELVSRLTDAEATSLLHAIGQDKDAVHDPLDSSLYELVRARLIESAESIINDDDKPQPYQRAAHLATADVDATNLRALKRQVGGGVFARMGIK